MFWKALYSPTCSNISLAPGVAKGPRAWPAQTPQLSDPLEWVLNHRPNAVLQRLLHCTLWCLRLLFPSPDLCSAALGQHLLTCLPPCCLFTASLCGPTYSLGWCKNSLVQKRNLKTFSSTRFPFSAQDQTWHFPGSAFNSPSGSFDRHSMGTSCLDIHLMLLDSISQKKSRGHVQYQYGREMYSSCSAGGDGRLLNWNTISQSFGLGD